MSREESPVFLLERTVRDMEDSSQASGTIESRLRRGRQFDYSYKEYESTIEMATATGSERTRKRKRCDSSQSISQHKIMLVSLVSPWLLIMFTTKLDRMIIQRSSARHLQTLFKRKRVTISVACVNSKRRQMLVVYRSWFSKKRSTRVKLNGSSSKRDLITCLWISMPKNSFVAQYASSFLTNEGYFCVGM